MKSYFLLLNHFNQYITDSIKEKQLSFHTVFFVLYRSLIHINQKNR